MRGARRAGAVGRPVHSGPVPRMSMRYLPLLLLLVPACDGRAPWSTRAGEGEAGAAVGFGPVAAFERRLLFVAPAGAAPTVAGFDFALVNDSVRIYRSARIVLARDSVWRTVMDTAWSMEPMRDAWRLVPFGDMQLVVGEGDELEAIVVRGEPETRLVLRRSIDEFGPDAGTRLQLREADLVTGDTRIPGLLLDIQLGRPISASGASRTISAAAGGRLATPVLEAATLATGAEQVEAIMVGDALLLALGESVDGPLAWLRDGQQDDVWEGARLVFNDIVTGDTVPDWQLLRGDGSLAGALFTWSRHAVALPGQAGGDLGLTVARGWIQVRGEQHSVLAVLRHVQG